MSLRWRRGQCTTPEEIHRFEQVRRRLAPPVFLGIDDRLWFSIVVSAGSMVLYVLMLWLTGLRSGWAWCYTGLMGCGMVAIVWLNRRELPGTIEVVRDGWLAEGWCPSCGYDLSQSAAAPHGCTVCPECGAAWRVHGHAAPTAGTSR